MFRQDGWEEETAESARAVNTNGVQGVVNLDENGVLSYMPVRFQFQYPKYARRLFMFSNVKQKLDS